MCFCSVFLWVFLQGGSSVLIRTPPKRILGFSCWFSSKTAKHINMGYQEKDIHPWFSPNRGGEVLWRWAWWIGRPAETMGTLAIYELKGSAQGILGPAIGALSHPCLFRLGDSVPLLKSTKPNEETVPTYSISNLSAGWPPHHQALCGILFRRYQPLLALVCQPVCSDCETNGTC